MHFFIGPLKIVFKEEFQACSEEWCPGKTRNHSGKGLILMSHTRHAYAGNILKRGLLFRFTVALSLFPTDSVNTVPLWARLPANRHVEAPVLLGSKSRKKGDLSQKVFHRLHVLSKAGSPSEIWPLCLLWLF